LLAADILVRVVARAERTEKLAGSFHTLSVGAEEGYQISPLGDTLLDL